MKNPSTVPRLIVTSAPIAFHQNQNTFGKNSQRMMLTPTPVAAATLAASGGTLGMVVRKKIPRIGPYQPDPILLIASMAVAASLPAKNPNTSVATPHANS